jgi:hypothetical protein
VALLVLLIAAKAFATPPDASAGSPDPGAQAVEIGRLALEAYASASWDTAYRGFSAAERLVHSPVFVLYMARCRRNSGRLLEARDLFRSVAREPLLADAPASWSQAVAAGHSELGTLQQNIPSIWIRKRSGSKVQAVVINGRTIPVAVNGTELELDPSQQSLEIVHEDGVRSRLALQLREGRRGVPVWLPAGTGDASTEAPPVARRSLLSTSKVIGYSALGVGAAGIITGAITGLIAKNRTDNLKQTQCDETGDCYAEARGEAETASRWAFVSTLSFIVGSGALVSGGGVLLFAANATPSSAAIVLHGAF